MFGEEGKGQAVVAVDMRGRSTPHVDGDVAAFGRDDERVEVKPADRLWHVVQHDFLQLLEAGFKLFVGKGLSKIRHRFFSSKIFLVEIFLDES